MENPHTENTMSEETRLMMMNHNHPAHRIGEAMNNLIDEITRPNHVAPKVRDHTHLLDELSLIEQYFMELGGQTMRFNAAVLRAAISVIANI